jgi:hypothetical protein
MKAGVTQGTICQRLRDEHGLAVSVASFRRFTAANIAEAVRRSQVVVLDPRAALPARRSWWPLPPPDTEASTPR